MVRLGEVQLVLEEWYPPSTAADWDAVGLVWGDPGDEVRRILLAVDPVQPVADEAAAFDADLLIVHHPLFLTAVHGVGAVTPKGKALNTLARAGSALYTAHTNADIARGGVSESLAIALGLSGLRPILPEPGDPEIGTGRIGEVPRTTLGEFAEVVAAALPGTAHGVRVAGDLAAPVRTVAVCGGSGDFLLDGLAAADVDVYLTSDLRHHRAGEFLETGGPALLDVSHWAAEWTWLPVLAGRLTEALGDTVAVRVSLTATDPWSHRI
ncbi:MAG: Nif3-like dinuclear metal center hexameric protein [Nocardioides sp.]